MPSVVKRHFWMSGGWLGAVCKRIEVAGGNAVRRLTEAGGNAFRRITEAGGDAKRVTTEAGGNVDVGKDCT